MYAQGGGTFTGPSPYTGQISLLTGPNFNSPVPIVTQLPTSNHDHGVNAMVFDNRGDLLVLVGGNTNAGVAHAQIGDLPESPLSAAILKVELNSPGFNGALSYVETATGLANNDQVFGEEVDLAPGTHVVVQATGLRNAFDLCLTTKGLLYATDNGPNSGFGVASTGPTTDSGVHPYQQDELNLIEFDNYYGHPNRCRGRNVPIENIYLDPSQPVQPGFTQALAILNSSTNGLVEYRARTFNDQIRGNLFAQRMSTATSRIVLSADGRSVVSVNAVSPAPRGLGLTDGPGGALIAMDYFSHKVRVYMPNDAAANGVTPFDITPWRAPSTGGRPFVIGGLGFGTISNTSVTIGGVPAALTAVSSTRIRGIVPELTPGMQPVDVSVTSNGTMRIMNASFLRMHPSPGQLPGTWTSAASMPQPVGEIAAGVIDGKMYVVGEGSTKTFRYNFLNNTWVDNMAIRQFTGHHHASEVFAGKWYLIGGLGQGAGTVQIYDPVTNSWSLGASMPWNGGSVCTALIDGKIYASGGIVGSTTVDNCAAYDISANSWTNLASAPFQLGRNHAAASTDGERFFIFGGRGIGSGAGNVVANGFPDVFVYDPSTNTWMSSRDVGSPLVPMPIGRGGMGKAVFYRNEFYVMGGETLNGPGAQPGNVYNRVDVYNPLNNSWRLDASMPTARHGIFPVVYQGKIYVPAGGTNAGFSQSSVHEVFSRQ
jgi:N-acetylneuraminic acid mutarotase/glucose/arabinose dehydrogenase